MRAEGRSLNQEEAMNIFEKMCSVGRGFACSNFAVGLLSGRGRARNDDLADAFLARGCRLGDGLGCQLLRDQRRFTEVDNAVQRAVARTMKCSSEDGAEADDDCIVGDAGSGIELR